jgi:cytochrome c5
MMSIRKTICLGLLMAATPCFSQTTQPAVHGTPVQGAAVKSAASESSKDDAGQRAFNNNCSRCHNAPQGFSPHISGTIVMHMRARANLSKKDEQDILRFLNP